MSGIGNIGVFRPISRRTVSQKRCKIGPRLLLITNRKSHTRFRLVPKSTNLDDLERPLRIMFQNAYLSAHHENLNEERSMLSAAKMESSESSFRQCQVYADIRGVPWRDGVKQQCGCRERQFSVISLAISSETLRIRPTSFLRGFP